MTSMQTVVVEYATASAGQTYRPAISMKYTLTVVFSGATPAVAAKDERPAITTALSRTEACIFPRVYTRRADSCWRMTSMRRCWLQRCIAHRGNDYGSKIVSMYISVPL